MSAHRQERGVDSPRPGQLALPDLKLPTGHPASEARREVLKKFGRYAAVAPTAMLLLEPRQSHAGPDDKDKKDKDKDKKNKDKKDKGGYD
jgi:hypothetical protein